MCCLTVAGGRAISDHEGLCEAEEAEQLLREGVCAADFMRFSPRVFTRAPRPAHMGGVQQCAEEAHAVRCLP